MSKLAQFREWLELNNAAQYLSAVWGESVTPADVLRLGLDGKLTLSVHLVNLGYGREVDIVPVESLRRKEFSDPLIPGATISVLDGEIMNATQAMKIRETDTALKLSGVYDLPMIGAEEIQIENAYQEATGGPTVELVRLAGAFVQQGGRTYQILERWPSNDHHERRNEGKSYLHLDWFFPSQELPGGSVIVVRTDALRQLEPTQSNSWGNHDTELLRHMRAAAAKFWVNYDPNQPDTAPTNEQVKKFLIERRVTDRMASAIASILRADGLPPGPRK